MMRKSLLITTLLLVFTLVIAACGGAGTGTTGTGTTGGAAATEMATEAAGGAAATEMATEAAGGAAATEMATEAAGGAAATEMATEAAGGAAATEMATEAAGGAATEAAGTTGTTAGTGTDACAMLTGGFTAGSSNINFGSAGEFTMGTDDIGMFRCENGELVVSGGTCGADEARYTVSGDATAGYTFAPVGTDACSARNTMMTGGAFMAGGSQ